MFSDSGALKFLVFPSCFLIPSNFCVFWLRSFKLSCLCMLFSDHWAMTYLFSINSRPPRFVEVVFWWSIFSFLFWSFFFFSDLFWSFLMVYLLFFYCGSFGFFALGSFWSVFMFANLCSISCPILTLLFCFLFCSINSVGLFQMLTISYCSGLFIFYVFSWVELLYCFLRDSLFCSLDSDEFFP